MEPLAKAIIVLSVAPFLVAAIHALMTRLFTFRPAQLGVAAAAAAGCAPTAAALWFVYLGGLHSGALATAACYSALVYLLMAYSYFHLFNMSETARRIRILREIGRNGRIGAAELERIYGPGPMLEARLGRLEASGQAGSSNGRYFLRSRVLYVAAKGAAMWAGLLGFDGFGRHR